MSRYEANKIAYCSQRIDSCLSTIQNVGLNPQTTNFVISEIQAVGKILREVKSIMLAECPEPIDAIPVQHSEETNTPQTDEEQKGAA